MKGNTSNKTHKASVHLSKSSFLLSEYLVQLITQILYKPHADAPDAGGTPQVRYTVYNTIALPCH